MSERLVDCGEHGMRGPAFICGHAFEAAAARRPQPFYWTDLDEPDPCGWCEACHARYLAAGEEWTEEAEAGLDLRLVCIDCFRAIVELNGTRPC